MMSTSQCTPGHFHLHKIFKRALLKFTVYGRKQVSKHTQASAQCSPTSAQACPYYFQRHMVIQN